MTGTPLDPVIAPGTLVSIPPDTFNVSVDASFDGLTFEAAIEVQKVLMDLLKELQIHLYNPTFRVASFRPSEFTSAIRKSNAIF